MAYFSKLIRSSLIGLWLLLVGLQALPSYAADPWRIDDLAVLEDPNGRESIASVSQPARAAEFRPAPHGFSAGYTRSVHWLRFTLHAPPLNAAAKREMLLEIHPAYLDDLQIYVSQPDQAGQFDMRTGGDLRAHANKEYPYRTFVYQIDFDDARSRTVYGDSQASCRQQRFYLSGSFGFRLSLLFYFSLIRIQMHNIHAVPISGVSTPT